jgi:hypothetical protein
MFTRSSYIRAGAPLLLACLAAGLWLPASALAQTVPPTLDAPQLLAGFNLLKSEFVDDVRFGKDPFFPRSTRRYGQRVTPTIEHPTTAAELSLNGISGSKKEPLAILNYGTYYRTFAVGESADMRVKGQIVKVTCVEISDKVVKITVNGVPQELQRPRR